MLKGDIYYLGDVHGNINVINQFIKLYNIENAHIIQVGDFGVGFKSIEKEKRLLEMYHTLLVKKNITVWAIRGNHDYKPHFDNDPFGLSNIKLLPDYSVLELCGKKILCVGGAVSVDRKWRMTKLQKQGDHISEIGTKSWWPDEVFSLDVDKASSIKDIDIILTHTCPAYCPPDNTFSFGPFVEGIIKETGDTDLKTDLNVERQQMNELFHLLKLNGNNIEKHYYGHFHASNLTTIDGCEHRMLGVGELWEEKLDSYEI
jgi:predicted phosphodiesterase